MVKSGDGGARRPAPPVQGRPAPKPGGRPIEEEVEEKTSALNLADVNLDDIDEMPMPKAAPAPAKRAPAAPSRPAPADDGEEKTSALNLADVNLDEIDEMPMPKAAPKAAAPQAKPAPAPAPRAAPAPAAAAAPERKPIVNPAARGASAPVAKAPTRPADDDDGNEKTAAVSSDELDRVRRDLLASRAAGGAAKAAAAAAASAQVAQPAKAAPAPAPAPKAVAPVPKAAPVAKAPPADVVEKTMAVSLDDLEPRRGGGKPKAEPAAADRTFLVDDDDVPVVKAPAAKKVGGSGTGVGGGGGGNNAGGGAAKKGAVDPSDLDLKLFVKAGPDAGKSFPVTKDLTLIGRGLDADIVINDASASRKHFNIVRTLSGWKLVDLGSGNGTRVNGSRVSEQLLEQGTTIECGGTTMEARFEEPPAAAAPAKKADVKRETVKEDAAPARHPGTLFPGSEEAPASRRGGAAQEDKAGGGRRRDVSRFDESDEKEKGKGKGGGGGGGAEGEEKTQFANIAELSIDPAWEKRRNAQRKDAPADMVPVSGSDEEDLEAEIAALQAKKKGGLGKKLAITGVAVAVLGGGFVAVDKFAGLGVIFPAEVSTVVKKDDSSGSDDKPKTDEKKSDEKKEADKGDKKDEPKKDEPKKDEAKKDEPKKDEPKKDEPKKDEVGNTTPATPEAKEAAKKLIAEGNALAKDGKVFAAHAKFTEALKSDGAVDGGKVALATSEVTLKEFALIVAGQKTFGTKKWQDGVDALKKVPETSPLSATAKAVLADVEHAYMLEQATTFQAAFAKKDWAATKAALELMLKEMPDAVELTSAKTALEKASAADADVLDVSALEPSDPRVKTPPKAGATDFKPAFDEYAKAGFEAALNVLYGIVPDAGKASKGDVARSAFFSNAVSAVGDHLKSADEAVKAKKPDDALKALDRAEFLDTLLGGQLRAKIDGEIGKVYAALVKKATDDKKPFDAAVAAVHAVALDAKSPLAKSVVEPAVKDAKANFAKAKAAAKEQPDQAFEAAMKAMQLLPVDDADYAAAAAVADELLKL